MKILIVVLLFSILSCANQASENNKTVPEQDKVDSEKIFQKNLEESKKANLEKIKVENQLKELIKEGLIGLWECNYSGYESNIKIYKKSKNFFSEIDFTKSNMKTKTEKLIYIGGKYSVQNSKSKEYYLIKKDGNLEMGDKQGLFTTAWNIMPGFEKQEMPKFDLNKVIGQSIFTVVGNYSKSQPQTLKGTNNEHWIVYYKDLNTEFKVTKGNNKIVSAFIYQVEKRE